MLLLTSNIKKSYRKTYMLRLKIIKDLYSIGETLYKDPTKADAIVRRYKLNSTTKRVVCDLCLEHYLILNEKPGLIPDNRLNSRLNDAKQVLQSVSLLVGKLEDPSTLTRQAALQQLKKLLGEVTW
jgi:hypothetical protein